ANAPSDDDAAPVVAALGRSADPDLALAALVRLADAADDRGELLAALRFDAGLRARLSALLGTSIALGDHLALAPSDWQVLSEEVLSEEALSEEALSEEALSAQPTRSRAEERMRAAAPGGAAQLRLAYRRELIAIAGRDLAAELDLD